MKCKVSTLSIGFLSLVMLFSANAVTPTERQYLVDFYNSTNGDNWTSTQQNYYDFWDINNPSSDPCTWFGIECDINQNIVKISLSSQNLVGTIPSNFTDLSALTEFYVVFNQLSGQIPDLPSNLVNFVVAYNQLEGPIPPLPDTLEYFHASNNNLTGSLPALPTNLNNFHINDNQLTGYLPNPPATLVNSANAALCPNYFNQVDNTDWDISTGESPWYSQCLDAPKPATKVQKIPALSISMLLAGLTLLAAISIRIMRKR